jgi:plastocyanin
MNLRARIGFLLTAMLLTSIAAAGLHRVVAAGEGAIHTVRIEDMKFSPAVVRIRAGERVTFVNHDLMPHTATARGGKIFDSGLIKPGESWTFQPPPDQSIDYSCLYHPTMAGQIIVEPR